LDAPFFLNSNTEAFLTSCAKEKRNKQNFIYRNGCAKEISKKIKDRKNKK